MQTIKSNKHISFYFSISKNYNIKTVIIDIPIIKTLANCDIIASILFFCFSIYKNCNTGESICLKTNIL